MARTAERTRKTTETDVSCSLSIDGQGRTDIGTGIGFLDHMLELFGRHGLFDLTVQARGDTHVDAHHTVEDVGIVLGTCMREALGERKGIVRYGFASVPMDEALVQASVDVSGRGRAEVSGVVPSGAPIDPALFEGFLDALATNAAATIHVEVRTGRDPHHVVEASFKALARALRAAVKIDPAEPGVPSTKGVL